MTKEFYSNGKLLLTGEYAVLDGALGLAVPTKFGQSLTVNDIEAPQLIWKSIDDKGKVWYESDFDLNLLFSGNEKSLGNSTTEVLSKILREAKNLNTTFLTSKSGCEVITKLGFPKSWGLGSSSTLINNIAQWAEIDAYELLSRTFTGSGYDIACANSNHPILYSLKKEKPFVTKARFNPPFRNQLYFIYLDKKQNSREGIARYREMSFNTSELTNKISEITEKVVRCTELSAFQELISEHEHLISDVIRLPSIKKSFFPDYEGAIKSLGAWGGDFILATGDNETPNYFQNKGFDTVIAYSKMVL